MSRLEALRNLGPKTALMLAEAGIADARELREVGAIDAFLKLRATTAHRVSLVALYAMHAALLDRDWRNLSEEERAALRHAVG